MPDIFIIFFRWWKFILGITFTAVVIVVVLSALLPQKYLSTATALPASNTLSNKSSIFNENIEELYPVLGTADDLEKIEGTARLDTIFINCSRVFDLPSHYKISGSTATYKAALRLKKETKIVKSPYGELKVRVWDTHSHMAANLANRLLDELQLLHKNLQNIANAEILQNLKKELAAKQLAYERLDSSSDLNTKTLIDQKKQSLLSQFEQYERLIGQYELIINTNPPVLLVVERARPSSKPDKPDMLKNILFSLFGSFLFSFILAAFLESKNGKGYATKDK